MVKVSFERLETSQRVGHVAIQGKKVPGRDHSKCQGPEAGSCLACSGGCKEAMLECQVQQGEEGAVRSLT